MKTRLEFLWCYYSFALMLFMKGWWSRQCLQIGRQYGMTNKAAIAWQSKSNVKLIAALLFIEEITISLIRVLSLFLLLWLFELLVMCIKFKMCISLICSWVLCCQPVPVYKDSYSKGRRYGGRGWHSLLVNTEAIP